MELVEAIFYRKINPSDFKKMYNIDIPSSGGGQTYIEAAGIPDDILETFLEYGDKSFSNLSEERRSIYTIDAHVVGSATHANIEFAPRKGRNYRISRQNMKYKHPAWQLRNGFPEPNKDSDGSYSRDFSGIIDNLIIYIIRTSKHQYYAGFINSIEIPSIWPLGIGLQQMTNGEKRGVLFFSKPNIAFLDDPHCPFSIISAIDDQINIHELPEEICEDVSDAAEYSSIQISITVDYPSIKINEVTVPKGIAPTSVRTLKASRKGRKKDYVQSQKNKKLIGDTGEEVVIEIERRKLREIGRSDLADQVEWVSKQQGDGLGYDILSFDIQENLVIPVFIEVKTTTAGINKPFDVSANEIEFSDENKSSFYIYRIFELSNNSSEISYYKVKGSITDNFDLIATEFSASPK